jgi:hypothetical protein
MQTAAAPLAPTKENLPALRLAAAQAYAAALAAEPAFARDIRYFFSQKRGLATTYGAVAELYRDELGAYRTLADRKATPPAYPEAPFWFA